MKRIFQFLSILSVSICSTVINIILFGVFCVFLAFYLCEVGNICIIYPCADLKVELKVLDFYFIVMVITLFQLMPLIQLPDNEFLIILLSLQFFNSIASAVIIGMDLSKYMCILSTESRSLHGEITYQYGRMVRNNKIQLCSFCRDCKQLINKRYDSEQESYFYIVHAVILQLLWH